VLNPASRAVVEGEVIGPGRVRVAPGTTPALQAGARSLQLSSNAFVRSAAP
jgi:hypothetical protein